MARKIYCDRCHNDITEETRDDKEQLLLPVFEEETIIPIKGMDPVMPNKRLVYKKVDLCAYDKKELAQWLATDPHVKGEDAQ
ncbi:MAG: hypothetical protein KGI08_01975 [Thaumarchaeota archaeon]|nr:hypothetical protein [Nitrososphaerota archaeon]